jgi:superfamily II DNA or RNA helicase
MNLYNHQKELIQKNPSKWLLAHETGTGKTVTAIGLVENKPTGLLHTCLIVCPKALTIQWAEKIKEFSTKDIEYNILSKENFKKNLKNLPKYDCVIFDEGHYFSGKKSSKKKNKKKNVVKRYMFNLRESALYYINKYEVRYIYLLTATPYLSTPWNVYALAEILGCKWNYIKYRDEFFFPIKMGKSKNARIIWEIRSHIEGKIAQLVNNIGNTVKIEDCVDMPKSVFELELFELTKSQERGIKLLDDIMPIVRYTKIHQICGGVLKSDGYSEEKTYESAKLDRVLQLVEQSKKIIVVCRYNAEIEMIAQMIVGRQVLVINGSVDDKDTIVKKANESDDCVLLINAACCEGYQLPTFNLMVFYSYDYSLKNYIQMMGRIKRIDHPQRCVYLSLIVKDTIDHDIYENVVIKKQDFHAEIYEH